MSVTINTERCPGCGSCMDACSKGALEFSEGRARTNARYCIGCRRCEALCPVQAIQENL